MIGFTSLLGKSFKVWTGSISNLTMSLYSYRHILTQEVNMVSVSAPLMGDSNGHRTLHAWHVCVAV